MKATGEAALAKEIKVFKEYTDWEDDLVEETQFSITTNKADIEKLIAFITEADSDVANLAKEIGELDAEIAAEEADKKSSTEEREKEHAEYLKTQRDLAESVDALERAIQTLEAEDYSRPQAEMLLQKMAKKTRGMRRVFAAFLELQQQEPGAPEVAAYEFQSSNIISILEGLLKKFKGQLSDVETAESNTAHAYNLEQVHLANLLEKNNADREEKIAFKAKRAAESSEAKGQLEETKAELAANEKLLLETETTYASKTKDFEANQKVRKLELEAIVKAIEIVSSPEVQESYATHINFLQHSSHRSLLRAGTARSRATAQAVAFLKSRATALSSKVLADTAALLADSPFAKVIQMIEDLLARLKEEAAAEADHKAWCDDQLKKNKLKRDKKTAKVGELSAEVEEYEASIATMAAEIKTLLAEIEELTKAMEEATKVRTEEKATNEATIADAIAGQDAVKKAMVILKEFYDSQEALLQTKKQVPELAPYKGMQGAKKGVLGMMEVIESDFARLQAETTAAEETAAHEYEQFMAESKASKEQKHEAEYKLSLEKDQAEFELGRTKEDLEGTQKELDTANEYYEYLKPNCLEVHVSYEERVALRKEEIEALKEAYKILDQKGKSA